jgi:NADH:ubiquinone oxidoreductase subunit 4 (subunit M)
MFLSLHSSALNTTLSVVQTFSLSDRLSLLIVYLLLLIIVVAYVNSLEFGSYKLIGLVFLSLTLFCFEVFTTSHLFYLYFFYEASLIPILYIIIK